MGTRYSKGEYVKVVKTHGKYGYKSNYTKPIGKIVSLHEINGVTHYKVLVADGEIGTKTAMFKASDLRYPEPKTISINGVEIERGDKIVAQHGRGDSKHKRSGEVQNFSKKDGRRIVTYGDPQSSTGSWVPKDRVLKVNGRTVRSGASDLPSRNQMLKNR